MTISRFTIRIGRQRDMEGCRSSLIPKKFYVMTKESCHFEGAERLKNPIIRRFLTLFGTRIPRGVYTERSECARNDKSSQVVRRFLAMLEMTVLVVFVQTLCKSLTINRRELCNCEWSYALLGENAFYSMKSKGASIEEILEYSKLTKQRVEG